MTIPVAEFASRHWRISRQKAYDRIKRINFPIVDGKVDEAGLLAAYAKYRNPAQDFAPKDGQQSPAGEVVDGESFEAARTRKMRAEADAAEFEAEIMEGKYGPIEDGKRVFQQCGSIWAGSRAALLQLAPQLVGKTLEEIKQILKQGLREADTRAAEEIRRRFPKINENPDDHSAVAV